MLTPQLLTVADGRVVEYYDARVAGTTQVVIYHHGTPNVGEPPVPLLEASSQRGIGWVSLSRPGYGASTRMEGRDIAQVATDVEQVADVLGIERFAVLGHSGGSPHALACAAQLPDRVSAAVSIAGLAPLAADGLAWNEAQWFEGMYPGGQAELQAAREGAQSLGALLAQEQWDPEMFTSDDFAMLEGSWAWFNHVVELAHQSGPGGMIDDDMAYVRPWGFELDRVACPTLLMHGGRDRVVPGRHSKWLAERIGDADLWWESEESHVSVLRRSDDVLDWLAAQQ